MYRRVYRRGKTRALALRGVAATAGAIGAVAVGDAEALAREAAE